MGLPFRSGHVLGLRRPTASSVGDGFTSIWHRDPDGRWTFYESVPSEVACTRYFGVSVECVQVASIALDRTDDRRLRVSTADGAVDWTIELEAHLRDFYIPQRGIFAIGRVFVTRVRAEVPAAELAAEVLR
jgi:hypothetical protein